MIDPYSGGCWDIVFTGDDPYSRPDPYPRPACPVRNTYRLDAAQPGHIQRTCHAPSKHDVDLDSAGSEFQDSSTRPPRGPLMATDFSMRSATSARAPRWEVSTAVYENRGDRLPDDQHLPTSGTLPTAGVGTLFRPVEHSVADSRP